MNTKLEEELHRVHRKQVKAVQSINPAYLVGSIERIIKCKGTIHTTGIGKSALVAQKLSTTLSMIGLKAEYIHPVDSLHGGLNKIKKEDIIFIVSNSGKTKELIDFIMCTRQLCDEYHLLTSNSVGNKLLKVSDYSIVLPVESIKDEYHIPSMSYLAASAVVDMMVYGICNALTINKKNIIKSHPAGNLE